MVRREKDNRRKNAVKNLPKPCWAQAFMIILLHKTGGNLTVSLADLKRFEALEGDNQTKLTFDKVAETVTITAPEMIMPKIVHNKGIITN